ETMAGIVKQADVGALQLRPEALHGGVEAGLVEVELRAAADQLEAEALQCICHELCVVRRVRQSRHAAVVGVADDERYALAAREGRWPRQRSCESSLGYGRRLFRFGVR